MAKERHTPEQSEPATGSRAANAKLREADVRLAAGEKTKAVCRSLGIAEQTYYRWRREYGGLKVDQARRLKSLEENLRLRKAVSDLTLDAMILIVGGAAGGSRENTRPFASSSGRGPR